MPVSNVNNVGSYILILTYVNVSLILLIGSSENFWGNWVRMINLANIYSRSVTHQSVTGWQIGYILVYPQER
jgi:hypothetical protein